MLGFGREINFNLFLMQLFRYTIFLLDCKLQKSLQIDNRELTGSPIQNLVRFVWLCIFDFRFSN